MFVQRHVSSCSDHPISTHVDTNTSEPCLQSVFGGVTLQSGSSSLQQVKASPSLLPASGSLKVLLALPVSSNNDVCL